MIGYGYSHCIYNFSKEKPSVLNPGFFQIIVWFSQAKKVQIQN